MYKVLITSHEHAGYYTEDSVKTKKNATFSAKDLHMSEKSCTFAAEND
jgi:hypothetical protein